MQAEYFLQLIKGLYACLYRDYIALFKGLTHGGWPMWSEVLTRTSLGFLSNRPQYWM